MTGCTEEPRKEESCESFWSQAKICYEKCSQTTDKKEKVELLKEGQKLALSGLEQDGKDFESLRWAAVTTGQLTDFLSTRERVEQGGKFKEYLDRALALNGEEFSLLHMRGRYSYSIAGLSWIEKKAVSILYCTLPTATYEEALADFLAAYEQRPVWIENLVFIGRCYLEHLKKKEDAKKYLEEALKTEPADENERTLLKEAKKLIAKC